MHLLWGGPGQERRETAQPRSGTGLEFAARSGRRSVPDAKRGAASSRSITTGASSRAGLCGEAHDTVRIGTISSGCRARQSPIGGSSASQTGRFAMGGTANRDTLRFSLELLRVQRTNKVTATELQRQDRRLGCDPSAVQKGAGIASQPTRCRKGEHHPHPTLPLKGRAFRHGSTAGFSSIAAHPNPYPGTTAISGASIELPQRRAPSPPNPPLEREGFQARLDRRFFCFLPFKGIKVGMVLCRCSNSLWVFGKSRAANYWQRTLPLGKGAGYRPAERAVRLRLYRPASSFLFHFISCGQRQRPAIRWPASRHQAP